MLVQRNLTSPIGSADCLYKEMSVRCRTLQEQYSYNIMHRYNLCLHIADKGQGYFMGDCPSILVN